MIWPSASEIESAKNYLDPDLEIILQVGKEAMANFDNDPIKVALMLERYDGIIDRILLDKSGGKGLGMNAQVLLPFVREIRDRFPDLGITVAGGLGPDTMHLVEPIIAEMPDVSIDAQGRLRPSGDAHDPIDWGMAEMYLIKALGMVT